MARMLEKQIKKKTEQEPEVVLLVWISVDRSWTRQREIASSS